MSTAVLYSFCICSSCELLHLRQSYSTSSVARPPTTCWDPLEPLPYTLGYCKLSSAVAPRYEVPFHIPFALESMLGSEVALSHLD